MEKKAVCTLGSKVDKAVHAAMLKSRFASTIRRAQQQLKENSIKTMTAKIKWTTLELKEEILRAEKHGARLGLGLHKQSIRSRPKKEREDASRRLPLQKQCIRRPPKKERKDATRRLSLQREKEREAARQVLREMEASVDVEDHELIMGQLRGLCGMSPSAHPLQNLGLRLKNEDDFDELLLLEEEIEEGEILPLPSILVF